MKPRAARRDKPTLQSVPVPPDILGEFDGVIFARERLGPLLREVLPLLRKDWEENGIDRDKVPFNLDLPRYLDYDLAGILQVVTARTNGALIGYMFALVSPHIDHASMGWAMITWYWLYPEYRGGGIGAAMLQAMEHFLREAKVSVVEGTEKIGSSHGMFERGGFRPTDTVYRKILE